jgi:Putative ABC exporter
MNGALVYLQLASLRNAVRQRVLRLRQPRYLIGLLVGGAYLYVFFFRRAPMGDFHGRAPAAAPAALGLLMMLGFVLVFMVGRIVYAWIFSADRAALAFTEAEVAFLFPAPVARRALVHFKLLKSQLRILFSALLLALVSDRVTLLGGDAWMHAAGWWILLSTVELHGIAASFTRQRLVDLGFDPGRRRLVFGGLAVIAVAAGAWWVGGHVPPPPALDPRHLAAVAAYVRAVAAVPPLPWLLAPFRWVLGPFFASNGAEFLRALGPALLVLAAHYVWVLRAEVSFEEASIDLSRRRAERLAALRAGGGWRSLGRPTRRRGEPFPLRPAGAAAPAFLWRNLIASGPWFYPRNWLLLSAAVLGGLLLLAARPASRPWLAIVQGAAIPLSFWVLFAVPMLLRRHVHLLFERLDVIKTLPLRGWQVLLGEMLAPMVLITAIEWLLLAMLAVATGALSRNLVDAAVLTGLGAVGIALLVPPLAGLMSAVPFAAALYFPDWVETLNQPRGMDVMGQRLLFAGGYLVVLLVALLPAALAAAGPVLLVRWLAGVWSVAVFAGAVAASVVLAGELAAVIWWLGGRWERFDLSRQLPQT